MSSVCLLGPIFLLSFDLIWNLVQMEPVCRQDRCISCQTGGQSELRSPCENEKVIGRYSRGQKKVPKTERLFNGVIKESRQEVDSVKSP